MNARTKRDLAEQCAKRFADPVMMNDINWDSLVIIDEYGESHSATLDELEPGMTIQIKYEPIDMLSAVPKEKDTYELTIDSIWREDGNFMIQSGDQSLSNFDFTQEYIGTMTAPSKENQTITQQQTQSIKFNDFQNLQMTQISYLDFNESQLEQLKGMKLADAEQYLQNPDLWSMGAQFNGEDQNFANKFANGIVKGVVGQEAYTTDGQLYQQCIDSGFGDLKIKDIANDPKTGFQAMALEDSAGNTYISFRGSDGDFSKGMAQDWYRADGVEFLEGDQGPQVKQAIEFFDKNKSENGENHIFGHSLGGNLTSHVFAQRENEIDSAFCYNANPIDSKYLDTPEKMEAFQSDRFTFAAVEGDVVSGLKDVSAYQNRVMYVENSERGNGNLLNNHLAEAASFDKDGNFIQSTKEKYMERQGEGAQSVLSFAHEAKDWVNNHEETTKALIQVCEGKWPDNLGAAIKEIGPEAMELLGKIKDNWEAQLGLDMDLSQMFEIENMFPAAKVLQDITGKDIIPDMNLQDIFIGEDNNIGEMIPQFVMSGTVGNIVQNIDVADIIYDASQQIEDIVGGAASGAMSGLFDFDQEKQEEDISLSFDRA